ncbi:MAG: FAD-binding protein, partial [Nitrososphaerales archaeon]
MTEEIADTKLSRRQFMGTAAAGAAALGAVAGGAALVPKVAGAPFVAGGTSLPGLKAGTVARGGTVPVPTIWTYSTDVVVVGYGGAGAVSAITAYQSGANVIILEKVPSNASLGITPGTNIATQISGGGGNTHISGGLVVWPTDPIGGAQHLYNLSFGATPMDVCMAWGTMANQNKAWLDSMGIPATVNSLSGEFPNVPGWSSISNYNVVGGGAVLFQKLDNYILAHSPGISVLFNTRGTDLIQDPITKEILGVQCLQNQSEVVNVQAKRAVIMCTGGFEYDDVMKVRFSKAYPEHFYGWQYNTGDGIKMGQKVGAAIWHMNAVSGRPEPWVPRINQGGSYAHATNSYIWVDRYGNRFLNEPGYPSHSGWCAMNGFNLTIGEYSNLPSFQIFDEACRKAGPVAGLAGSTPVQLGGTLGAGSAPGTPWSSDNSAEIAAGWIMSGPDIPTLAANIQNWTIIGSNKGMTVPPGWNSIESMDSVTIPDGTNAPNLTAATLTATVAKYNADCAAGKGDTL